MHSIKDLEESYGLSYWRARKRIGLIQEYFGDEVKGGENSKFWLTDNGLTILQRLLELEENGHTPKSAMEQIDEEVNEDGSSQTSKNDPEVHQSSPKLTEEYVNKLEEEIQFLRNQLEERDKQITQLLPKTGQSYNKVLERKSFWEVVKEWFKQPA